MAKMTVRKTIELPGDYKPYVFDSMHGSDGPGIHLDFTEEDGTLVSVRIPVSPLLIARLRDKLKELSKSE
jgi:hypothetical protein